MPEETYAKIGGVFRGYFANEDETSETIERIFRERGYLADTHTSVAISCFEKYTAETGDATPCVIVSTASPFKFAYDVCASLGKKPESHDPHVLLGALESLTGKKAPEPLKRTLTLPVRFTDAVDPEEMKSFIFR